MENSKDFELLDLYVQGKLSEDELGALTSRLANDPQFKKFFDRYLSLITTFRAHDRQEQLRRDLQVIHNGLMKEKSKYRERKLTRTLKIHSPTIAIAASVTLIVLIGSVLIFNYIESLRSRENDFRWLRRKVAQIELSQREIAATIRNNKPQAAPGSYTGTGFLISRDGYVITCYHLVQNEDSLALRNNRYGSLKAYMVKFDVASDLALLKIRDSLFRGPRQLPVIISDKESLLGEKVFTLGYPKYDVVYSEGVVSSASGYQGDTTSYQISLPLNPGNSGGPLVNENGYVIGIVNGKNITQEGSAFALKSYYLKNFLTAADTLNPVNISWNRKSTYYGWSRPQVVKNLSDYIFEVKVYE